MNVLHFESQRPTAPCIFFMLTFDNFGCHSVWRADKIVLGLSHLKMFGQTEINQFQIRIRMAGAKQKVFQVSSLDGQCPDCANTQWP